MDLEHSSAQQAETVNPDGVQNREADMSGTAHHAEARHSHTHGDSHHHHHHSHSKHRRSKRKPKSKIGRTLYRHRKTLVGIVLLLSVLAGIICFAVFADRGMFAPSQSQPGSAPESDVKDKAVLTIPYFSREVSLVVEAVSAYMQEDADAIGSILDRYKVDADTRLDRGLPVTISYDVSSLPAGCVVSSCLIQLSESPDMSQAVSYTLSAGKKSIDIYHLYTATTYYYTITLSLSDGNALSASSSFKTADTPRILTIGGVPNVRDIGGKVTADGRRIKQGLLYRGCELDGAVCSEYTISDQGRQDMLTVLGIRTDMDLRNPAEVSGSGEALGRNVQHTFYAAPAYLEAMESAGKASVKAIFTDLAKADRYPVYLHCTYGFDRTGTVCYILEALLGVPEEQLLREYNLSALYHGTEGRSIDAFIASLQSYPGSTMQRKAENYLLSAGVTDAQIDEIRSIFLD